jgi:3-hydroxyisobutyrate dehydrogenase-like beta-hydroxyacid dehydrogenase
MRKDFGLIVDAARETGAFMPVTEEASRLATVEATFGRDEDFSAVVRLMEQWRLANAAHPPAA